MSLCADHLKSLNESLNRRKKIHAGSVFSKLTTLSPVSDKQSSYWRCVCECGTETNASVTALKRGTKKDCGCVKRATASAPVQKHPLYATWSGIKTRTTNPNSAGYKNYGGRGIRLCDSWLKSFKTFSSDMGPKPTPKHTIDRIDNDGDYEPKNCYWATADEQGRNTRVQKRKGVGVRVSSYRPDRYVAYLGSQYLGVFKSISEATTARKNAEAMHWVSQ